MTENPKVHINETQNEEEQATHRKRKADGIITTKMKGKTFVTEIFFDQNSKDTF